VITPHPTPRAHRQVQLALGVNIVAYFRVLLSDGRGWNVRNNVCHGLAPVSMLTMVVADRVLHALLVLALMLKRSIRLTQTSLSGYLLQAPRL
jgi:hypothetical protein